VVSSGLLSSWCSGRDWAIKNARFASFPSVLVVHAKKFQLVNWVPTKLGVCLLGHLRLFVWFSFLLCIDVPLIVPDDVVLDDHIGRGIQPGEVELPGDNAESPGRF
jgi:ubiquitin carboxyl-terminal hydrolase 5/13